MNGVEAKKKMNKISIEKGSGLFEKAKDEHNVDGMFSIEHAEVWTV